MKQRKLSRSVAYPDSLKVVLKGYLVARCFSRSSPALIASSCKCGKVTNFRQKFFSALRLLNWCECFSRGLLALSSLARQFEGFVYRWTARKKPDVIRFHLSENWKMFLNGGFVVALTQKGHLCEPFISGAWQVGLTASRKAERLSGLVCSDRRQGNRL